MKSINLKVEEGIATLQAKYEDCVRKKEELEFKTDQCQQRLIRADKVQFLYAMFHTILKGNKVFHTRSTLIEKRLLPPANEICEGYVFTPVCQSFCSQEGCVRQCMLGYTPLQEQTPPRADTPSVQYMLGDTGNKRAVRILLECILVICLFAINTRILLCS